MRKNILITGSKNTGFAIAERMAADGYNIHLTSRSLADAEAAAAKLRAAHPDVDIYPYSLEMSDVSDIRRLFAEIYTNVHSLDGFVANAANLGVGLDIFNTDENSFDSVMNTNLRGTFFCCQEAGRIMNAGGSIVILGSVQAHGAVEGRTVYGVSKAALSALSKYLAYDLAPYRIRVNCLVAGAIHTNRWDGQNEAFAASRRKNYPLGREADMEDIANGVSYLVTDRSKSTTGSELLIDSGVLIPILPYDERKQTLHDSYRKELTDENN